MDRVMGKTYLSLLPFRRTSICELDGFDFFLSENPWTIDPKEMKGDRLQRFCLHLRPSDDPLGSWLPPGLGDDDLSNDFFQLCLWWTFGDWRFQRSLWSPDKFPSQDVFLHLASLAKPDLRRWTPSEPRNPPKRRYYRTGSRQHLDTMHFGPHGE